MPSRGDLSIYQGDDYGAVVVVTNMDGTVADITGYTPLAQIRRNVADQDPVVVLQMSASVTSPKVFLGIPHAQTATLTGRYLWDLQLTSPAGGITTVVRGNVTVTPEITRPTS